MDDATPIEAGQEPRPGRARRRASLGVAAAGGVALAVALLWTAREPIARDVIDRELRARGVPATYRIARFGVSSQTLEDVALGDPAHPDLVARRATVHVAYRFGLPRLTGIEAEGVRLSARLAGGRLTMGAIDRLLPRPSGAPFALPDLSVSLADTVVELATPVGAARIGIVGKGNLAAGFEGRAAIASEALAAGGCRAERVRGDLAVRTRKGAPRLAGPLAAAAMRCATGSVAGPGGTIDVTLRPALDGWTGQVRLAGTAALAAGARARSAGIGLSFEGDAARTMGAVRIDARGVSSPAGGSAGALGFAGRFELAGGRASVSGAARGKDVALPVETLRAIGRGAQGTPAAEAVSAAVDALARAGRRFSGEARGAAAFGRGGAVMRLDRIAARSASGARLTVVPAGGGAAWRSDGGGPIDLLAQIGGGGVPRTVARLSGRAGARLQGEVRVAVIAGGGSRVALAPVAFARGGDGTIRLRSGLLLDGPVGDGRVEGLALPIEGVIGAGGYTINRACVPLVFRRLTIAGAMIGPSRQRLCPTGGSMLSSRGGGAALADVRLRGSVGSAPLLIGARRLAVALGRPGFAADQVSVRLGEGDDPTRLVLPRLDGRFADGGAAGRFTGAGGKIGKVPLLLSDGAGGWRLAGGTLSLDGGLRLADADPAPRFAPLDGRDVRLVLKDGAIRAAGTLHHPASGRAVATVTLRHDLSSGRGDAVLGVPALTFDPALQPEALTRLTLGVIANVAGTIRGEGRIRWSSADVTSDGDFATDGVDLAAAFGPVRGIKGSIHFSDLLGLSTPPGQAATIAEINPGIAVTGGTVSYQLLEGLRVGVESGRWPFAGGALTLEPTVMDFGRPVERRLTFRVAGMDAAAFIQQFDFKNISVTGTFDGTLPMVFGASGGRIERGRLVVRRGGGRLAYVGEVSNAALGTFGRLAFDALKSMRYESLAIELDGALDGELVSRVLFDGTNETPREAQRGGLLGKLTGLPFRFRITIRAPFRGLLNAASSLNDPRGLIRQALPPKGELPGSGLPIQPPSSEDKR